MKKTLNQRIPVMVAAIFIMTVLTAQGMHPLTLGENPARREILPSTIVWQKPIMLAQNEGTTTGDKDRTATGTKDRVSEAESGSATDPKDPAKSKTAPLKPFKPSEEIAAEQAVDFPVDI